MIAGIDVSKYNGKIDWNSVKSSGVSFAILRGGYSTVRDDQFLSYYDGATKAGIQVGIYWFSYALNVNDAIKEANFCVSVLNGKKINLPIFYDFEEDTERYANSNKVTYTNADRTKIMTTFCDKIISAGYTAGLYLNENYITNMTNYAELKKYPLWLAKWCDFSGSRCTGYTVPDSQVPTQHGHPMIWQFTDKGKINGIQGDVDLSYGYFTQTQEDNEMTISKQKLYLPYKTDAELVSRFGYRTLNGKREYHNGIDLCGRGSKIIVAPANGVIGNSTMITDKSNRTWEWGNYVRLDCDNGLQVFMCHMECRAVKTGQRVKVGDVIGIEGYTGYCVPANVNGRHCHFEVRKNGVSVDPTPYLGIKNEGAILDCSETAKIAEIASKSHADKYTHDGLTFMRARNFQIKYFDKPKRSAPYASYGNGGFFAYFVSESGEKFTLPVGNLVCDCNDDDIPKQARKYLDRYTSGGKLRYGCNSNQTPQYKGGRLVSTLIVPSSGVPYIDDVSEPASGCKYAISGVPTIRHGDDVDYYSYVKSQGFDESCMGAAYRTWIGLRDGEIWIITGKTSSKNFIYGMEFWKKVRCEGFDDVIAIDGGGSAFVKYNGSNVTNTSENRSVNNLIVF